MEVDISMRELRNTRRLKALLRAGKSIRLHDRSHVVAHIIPPRKAMDSINAPDFEERHRELFGDRVFDANDFLQDRHGRY